jgi:hypothetical protein
MDFVNFLYRQVLSEAIIEENQHSIFVPGTGHLGNNASVPDI